MGHINSIIAKREHEPCVEAFVKAHDTLLRIMCSYAMSNDHVQHVRIQETARSCTPGEIIGSHSGRSQPVRSYMWCCH